MSFYFFETLKVLTVNIDLIYIFFSPTFYWSIYFAEQYSTSGKRRKNHLTNRGNYCCISKWQIFHYLTLSLSLSLSLTYHSLTLPLPLSLSLFFLSFSFPQSIPFSLQNGYKFKYFTILLSPSLSLTYHSLTLSFFFFLSPSLSSSVRVSVNMKYFPQIACFKSQSTNYTQWNSWLFVQLFKVGSNISKQCESKYIQTQL